MFEFFANIFGYVLNFIYGIVNNYGLAIIIFTIILKGLMMPMNIKQQKTMKKSAKIQKKSQEIQEKYSNDPVRMNQELMDLYKREKMSPFSGCLSSIIQMVVILSIFFLVSRPLTFMKHVDSSKIEQYTQEIQEEGSRKNYTEIAIIREKSAEDPEVSLNMNFLGLNLSDIPVENLTNWTVYVIPILYVLTSFVSMKLSSNMKKNKNDDKEEKTENTTIEATAEDKALIKKEDKKDEIAMDEMNRSMALMMPVMSVSISMIAPLGLALYWFVSNLISIIERLIANKFLKEAEEE
jgi:YidC/Oxa1 family membrane protein insertase